MFNYYAFINELGSYNFEFKEEDTSKHFIITAVIIEKINFDDFKKQIKEIQVQYFPSRTVSLSSFKETGQRKPVINSLVGLPFTIYSIVINKERLNLDGGLGCHKSYFEFLNNILYKVLFKDFPEGIQVNLSQDSDQKFMFKFKEYANEKYEPSIFNESPFIIEEGSNNVLFQVVDLISEIIFEVFEDKRKFNKSFEILRHKVARIDVWPRRKCVLNFNDDLKSGHEFDKIITAQAINLAENYILKHDGSEELLCKQRVIFLKFLLTNLSIGRNKYIYSDEIIRNIATFTGKRVSKDTLMRKIIAPLRDEKLIIASSNSGYKLPTSVKDIIDFVDFSSSMILPMLSRLDICRKEILKATNNRLDIFEKDQFRDLKSLFDGNYK